MGWMRPRGEVPAAWTPGFTAQHCREVRAGGGAASPRVIGAPACSIHFCWGCKTGLRGGGGWAPGSQPGAWGTPEHRWPRGWGLRAASP